MTPEGRPLSYPGSPAIAQSLMRPQDRIALCEANPDEREALIAALGRDGRLSIVGTDGYVALNAYLPPKERRGIVLIDPPFEAPDEAGAVARALERALRKWPTGTYIAWRPIREARADAHFLNSVAALGAQTSCGSNWTLAQGRSARTAKSRSRARGFSSSIRRIRSSMKRGRCCRGWRKLSLVAETDSISAPG